MSIRIGITCGDVNGIGPEIALKAVSSSHWKPGIEFVLIGPEQVFDHSSVWPVEFTGTQTPGKITAGASKTAVAAIERAVHGCLEGELDAMVTAPICKEGLKLAGVNYPGHTEMIAELTGTNRYGMMLMGNGLRVMLVTRHLPLRSVADSLTKENVLEAIELTGEALNWFGLHNGRIGVCGLNPHAGDGGALGDEESAVIAPAIAAACAKGFNAAGPVPADVIFYQTLGKQYDAVVAMYHDQGLGPLKMHAFDCGVNLTLGLPIIRTSPDHGTAFNIAGKGIAKPDSMIAAIETAIRLAGQPNPWKK
ncbi:MAG TPA: 4-hydroxythreonine-4-phosphate dehydrogenase PdxA [Pontiellaceae bacterium]|nr:4-hydroxythreonine-4-phosphate dehydrogenase PdxA [Pontiellaceae bacterium]HPR83163.1 4-hydroxythreonine-4-phosphate dehydrogenase PdxA [Pontiellaceae bacterium]